MEGEWQQNHMRKEERHRCCKRLDGKGNGRGMVPMPPMPKALFIVGVGENFFFCKWRIIAGNGKREHPGRKAKRQGISPPWGKRQKNFRHQKRAQNMGDGILTWAEGVLTWAVQSAVNHFAINPRVHPSFLCLFLVPCFQIFLSLFFFYFFIFSVFFFLF